MLFIIYLFLNKKKMNTILHKQNLNESNEIINPSIFWTPDDKVDKCGICFNSFGLFFRKVF